MGAAVSWVEGEKEGVGAHAFQCHRLALLRLCQARESPVKSQILILQVGQGLRTCISDQLPGDAAGPGAPWGVRLWLLSAEHTPVGTVLVKATGILPASPPPPYQF